ncbi:MAG: DNA polymerase I [Elusimicrobia bacterium]|nr:DNA polymerase I [Elusimicrobiota bacterium]
MPKLVLVDAHGYLHRAYHALPPLTTPSGEPIHAVYGFARMLIKLLTEQKSDYIGICFDSKGATFREKIYPEYKANRKETDADLVSQFPLSRDLVGAMDLMRFEMEGFEADDLIATLSRKAESDGMEVLIVSGDKDLLQLVNDRIHLLNEPKQILFGPTQVEEKWGVPPEKLIEIFILMGDSSDNIPGVPGIGEKTAVKLIREYGSTSNLISHLNSLPAKLQEKLAAAKETIEKNRSLLSLRETVPLEIVWDRCKIKPFQPETLLPILRKWGFQSLVENLESKGLLSHSAEPLNETPKNYTIVSQEPELTVLLQSLSRCEHFSIHTAIRSQEGEDILGIAFSIQEGSASYIPFHSFPRKDILSKLKPILENEKIQKIGHDLKREYSIFQKCGIVMKNLFFDTMIAAYCLDPSKNNSKLKELASEILSWDRTRLEEPQTVSAELLVDENVPKFACAAADGILQMFQTLSPLLKERGYDSLFYEVEMPLVPILAEMELTGLKIDRGHLEELGKDFAHEIEDIEKKTHQLAGQEFNLNSSKQIAFILFEKLGLPPVKKKKTHYSTDEEVLHTLSPLHEIPALLLKHRELSKLKSTYVDGLIQAVHPTTKRVHTRLNQTGTMTGRLSSSDPNLQNIPIRSEQGRRIRRAFIPEEGYRLLSLDYSQIDLRVLAHLSQDPVLIQSFREGADIHRSTASEVWHVPMEQVSEEQRKNAKAINFGIVYGQQAYGLSQSLKISQSEAQNMIDQYFQRYAGVRNWIEQTIAEARKNGFVRTLSGRIRPVPEINAKNGSIRAFAERIAMNTPVQGSSADIIKIAMIHIEKELKNSVWKNRVRILLQVHDDLLFEVPEEEVLPLAKLVKKEMEHAMELSVPILVDAKCGKNWAEMEPLKV